MRRILTLILFINILKVNAQKWVDTAYNYSKTTVTYGQVVDFAGNDRTLAMDICVPNNDVPPKCGRPLLVAIHGGSFMAGSKNNTTIQNWMKDYAKRGYVTAAINYRLGMFQTSNAIHCNVTQLFNTPWDCLNMADTAEWYRASYRGIQDAKGAIRYLIKNKSLYNIDTRNIFLAGESAGGFIALGAAFLDTVSEKPVNCGAITSVTAPNSIYENACIQQFKWDTAIVSMRLTRPDLGSIEGDLNPTTERYSIKGIGNFFGGILPLWLENNTYATPPAIYMYHQPNDLIVPMKTDRVMTGYSICMTGFGCSNLISLPWTSGSGGIRDNIEQLKAQSKKVPEYWLDSTTNTADCNAQALNPALTGHAIDNYWLRSLHMAQYFAPLIDTSANCNLFINERQHFNSSVKISPNPFLDEITITTSGEKIEHIHLFDLTGRKIEFLVETKTPDEIKIRTCEELNRGFYFIRISGAGNNLETVRKLVKI